MALFDVTIPTDAITVEDEVFVNPIEIRFDQSAVFGRANRSRSDIVAGTVVDVINVTPGVVNSIELLWKPPEDDTAVLVSNGDDWIITPKAGTWGTYLIALTVDGVIVIHTFTVRSPIKGLKLGAANEEADRFASLVDWVRQKIEDSQSNEPLTSGGKDSAFGWWLEHAEIVREIEGYRVYDEAEDEQTTTNTGTSPVSALQITKPATFPAGRYRLSGDFTWRRSTGNNAAIVEVEQDGPTGTVLWAMKEEVSDTDASIRTSGSFSKEFALDDAAHTFDINFFGESGSFTTGISQVHFLLERVGV